MTLRYLCTLTDLESGNYSKGVAGTFETGCLHIEVVEGDILNEGTDILVNSIGPHLNFDNAGKY